MNDYKSVFEIFGIIGAILIPILFPILLHTINKNRFDDQNRDNSEKFAYFRTKIEFLQNQVDCLKVEIRKEIEQKHNSIKSQKEIL
jgi:hypothetical protein